MTAADQALVRRAQNADWMDIDFEDQAESREGREEIHRIRMAKYRAEEYMAGLD